MEVFDSWVSESTSARPTNFNICNNVLYLLYLYQNIYTTAHFQIKDWQPKMHDHVL